MNIADHKGFGGLSKAVGRSIVMMCVDMSVVETYVLDNVTA